MRALGHRVVDLLVAHYARLSTTPATGTASRTALEALLREPFPPGPSDPGEVLEQLQRDVFSHTIFPNHPRHYGWIPGPGNFVGALADLLASGFNVCPTLWLEASGPTEVELVTVDWLCGLCGLAEGSGGLFVSGGTVANLTALAVARRIMLSDEVARAVVYCSDQTHTSNTKNLRILGFKADCIRKVPTDDCYRMDMAALAGAVEADRVAGKNPFCVIANAGTTNTAAVDPLEAIASFCDGAGMWMHVDAAYGGAAMLSERARALLKGLERAHSITIDPHKWLFQPYDIGCVLVRDARWLAEAFREVPEYLQDVHTAVDPKGEVNLGDYGIQLSRSFRALKLWMSLKVFGLDAFRAAIDRGISNAERAEELLRATDCFEVVTPAQLGIVTFRLHRPGADDETLNQLNRALIGALVADGYAMLTSTTLRGRTALRLCTINPRTSDDDLKGTVERLAALAEGLS